MPELTHSGPALSHRNRETLRLIDQHPASGNVSWNDVVSLLSAVGDVTERKNGKYVVAVGGERETLERPRHDKVDKQLVVDIRRLLKDVLARSGQDLHNTTAPGTDAVLALDFHRARIFDIALAAQQAHDFAAPDPWELDRHLHHKYYFEHGHYDLDQADTDKLFAAVAVDLAKFDRIVVVGHGNGKANAAQTFGKWLDRHHKEVAGRIVGTVRADVDDITDNQLLRWAEEYFGQDVPTRDYGDSRRGEIRD